MIRSEELELLRRLLLERRVLSLAVLVEGQPYAGMLPFVTTPDFSALVVHASSLARHSRGLAPGASFSALIHAPDRPELDPLQLPRLTLQGSVRPLPGDSREGAAARALYLEKYPTSRSVFQLGDFHLFGLEVESGRLIAGFGSIHTLNRQTLAEAAAAATADDKPPAAG